MQFLVYDPNFNPETANPPSPEMMEAMGVFMQEAFQAGIIVVTGAPQPQGTRLKYANGQFTVSDGPFIELKELLAGFAVLELPSLEAAVEWSKRFRKIIGEGESEIVQLYGPHDLNIIE